MIWIVMQIVLALVLANLYEWVFHKYPLHLWAKKKTSIFHFHWSHHRNVRKSGGYDPDYEKLFPPSKEMIALGLLATLHAPLYFVAPWFAGTLGVYAFAYYTLHRHAHMNPKWGKRWMPWHYDHHLGKNQDTNWCILFPLWDHILRTRTPGRFTNWYPNAYRKNNRNDI